MKMPTFLRRFLHHPVYLFFKKYWLKLAELIATVNTWILLTVLYIIVFPLFAFPYKLARRFKKQTLSTWKTCEPQGNIEDQF